MPYQTHLLSVHEAILENKLEKALELLDQISKTTEQKHQVLLLGRRLSESQKNENLGLDTQGNISIENNRITAAILKLTEDIINEVEATDTDHAQIALLEQIIEYIDITHDTYIAQCKLRNILIDSLKARFEIEDVKNYYQIFSEYFSQMNEEELRYHRTIRGYTKNIIKENHFAVLDILDAQPELKKLVSKLTQLQTHLKVWKSKYDSLFEPDPSVSLIYIGVEEGVKFPTGIDHDLRKYVAKEVW